MVLIWLCRYFVPNLYLIVPLKTELWRPVPNQFCCTTVHYIYTVISLQISIFICHFFAKFWKFKEKEFDSLYCLSDEKDIWKEENLFGIWYFLGTCLTQLSVVLKVGNMLGMYLHKFSFVPPSFPLVFPIFIYWRRNKDWLIDDGTGTPNLSCSILSQSHNGTFV